MTLISTSPTVTRSNDDFAPWHAPPAPTALPTLVVDDGAVVALRKRPVVAMGALANRESLRSQRLVSAQDLAGNAWWIPAEAVWSDADGALQPQHPRPVGLAVGRNRDVAVLAGLSDRLGWEATVELQRGRSLPVLDLDGHRVEAVVYDGRLRHDIPTVVVIGPDIVLWGAGSTFPAAYHRALYGDDGAVGNRDELESLGLLLADIGLAVAAVDLGTPVIRRAGVARYSVQLAMSSHESGRPWDASPIN